MEDERRTITEFNICCGYSIAAPLLVTSLFLQTHRLDLNYLMTAEDEVLRQLQQQINALQASRQQQLELDTARAQAEVDLRRKAAETTHGPHQT